MTQVRTIEKRGVIKFTDIELKAYVLTLTAELVSVPSNRYYNVKTNPPESFYGYATIFHGEYLSDVVPLKYPRQVVYSHQLDTVQVAECIACLNRSVQQSILSLEAILSPAIKIGSLQPSYWSTIIPRRLETQVKFVLDEGVILRVVSNDYPLFECSPLDVATIGLTPDAPVGVPPSPPPITPPYDPSTQDNGDTYVPSQSGGSGSNSGIWGVTLEQDDCTGVPYTPFIFAVPGTIDDNPVLAASSSSNPGGTGTCCGNQVPLAYLVSSVDNRNMFPGGGNVNQFCGNIRISTVFIPN